MEAEIQTPEIIGRFSIKTKTVTGNLCKRQCIVYANGVVNICQLVLSEKPELGGFEKIYSKFGKNLFIKWYGIKYGSLIAIYKATTDILIANKIDPKNILQ